LLDTIAAAPIATDLSLVEAQSAEQFMKFVGPAPDWYAVSGLCNASANRRIVRGKSWGYPAKTTVY
jgi:hypothetical protein